MPALALVQELALRPALELEQAEALQQVPLVQEPELPVQKLVPELPVQKLVPEPPAAQAEVRLQPVEELLQALPEGSSDA